MIRYQKVQILTSMYYARRALGYGSLVTFTIKIEVIDIDTVAISKYPGRNIKIENMEHNLKQ